MSSGSSAVMWPTAPVCTSPRKSVTCEPGMPVTLAASGMGPVCAAGVGPGLGTVPLLLLMAGPEIWRAT
ncbi:MAG: hypothetical protein LC795_03425 [Acidobacteria bacterium]|nr:hypothetical protein [Acidobacteriota bacterium]